MLRSSCRYGTLPETGHRQNPEGASLRHKRRRPRAASGLPATEVAGGCAENGSGKAGILSNFRSMRDTGLGANARQCRHLRCALPQTWEFEILLAVAAGSTEPLSSPPKN